MTCWSCPFHAFQLPLHVPDIFSVCPLHFPCMSRSFVASHFPTSPVVPIGFLVLCFPFIPPALPLLSFLSLAYPFSSPLFPFRFPLLSCHVDFLFPSLISLRFLAFLLCSPIFPAKRFFQRFRNQEVQKHRVFSRCSAKGGRNPKPAKSRQGESSLGPLVSPRRLRLVERHQIAARSVGGGVGGGTYQTSGGGGVRVSGGLSRPHFAIRS